MLEKERKKPARRRAAPKAAPKPAAAATPVPRTVAPVVAATAPARRAVSAGERWRMVAEAAYYRANRRGFGPGDPVRDWVEAEAEIDAQLLERP